VHVAFAVALGFLTTPVPESAAQAEKFRMRRTYRRLDRVADASVAHIVLRTAAVTLGIAMLGAGLIGYLRGPTRLWERAVLLVGAFLLIFHGRPE
jgi:TRAP-type uncharacterized transport system fused permease subunit